MNANVVNIRFIVMPEYSQFHSSMTHTANTPMNAMQNNGMKTKCFCNIDILFLLFL